MVALSNSIGGLMERYQYTPYGSVKIYNGGGTEIAASAVGNPYLFTGRRYDTESGLYYYRARMYSPLLGRFMQTDPVGYYDSMNLYQYCGNNPVNWVDPSGRIIIGIIGTVVGLVGGGLTVMGILPIGIPLMVIGGALVIADIVYDPDVNPKVDKKLKEIKRDRKGLNDEADSWYDDPNSIPKEGLNDLKKWINECF